MVGQYTEMWWGVKWNVYFVVLWRYDLALEMENKNGDVKFA